MEIEFHFKDGEVIKARTEGNMSDIIKALTSYMSALFSVAADNAVRELNIDRYRAREAMTQEAISELHKALEGPWDEKYCQRQASKDVCKRKEVAQ